MVKTTSFHFIPVDEISSPEPESGFSADQIKALAEKIIKTKILLSPLIVLENCPGQYEVIVGHLNYYAAKAAQDINPRIAELVSAFVVPPHEADLVKEQLQLLGSLGAALDPVALPVVAGVALPVVPIADPPPVVLPPPPNSLKEQMSQRYGQLRAETDLLLLEASTREDLDLIQVNNQILTLLQKRINELPSQEIPPISLQQTQKSPQESPPSPIIPAIQPPEQQEIPKIQPPEKPEIPTIQPPEKSESPTLPETSNQHQKQETNPLSQKVAPRKGKGKQKTEASIEDPRFAKMTDRELRDLAKTLGINFPRGATRQTKIALIQAHQP